MNQRSRLFWSLRFEVLEIDHSHRLLHEPQLLQRAFATIPNLRSDPAQQTRRRGWFYERRGCRHTQRDEGAVTLASTTTAGTVAREDRSIPAYEETSTQSPFPLVEQRSGFVARKCRQVVDILLTVLQRRTRSSPTMSSQLAGHGAAIFARDNIGRCFFCRSTSLRSTPASSRSTAARSASRTFLC